MDPASLPLRDIHLPAEPGWWPPAPGWWLAFALTALLVALAAYGHHRRQRRRRSAASLAATELQAIRSRYARDHDARACVRAVSGLLRRLCISIFPRVETAGLTGAAWLAFLGQAVDATAQPGRARPPPALAEVGKLLLEAPYRRHVGQQEVEALLACCSDCIEALARRQALRARPRGNRVQFRRKSSSSDLPRTAITAPGGSRHDPL